MFKEDRDKTREVYKNIESTFGQKLKDVAKEQDHITRSMVEYFPKFYLMNFRTGLMTK